MKTILLFACALAAFGQSPVNQSAGPPPEPFVKQFFKDAAGNLTYVCTAAQRQRATTQKVSDASLTNIVVATNVATLTTAAPHALYQHAQITISGATVAPALNGVYAIATIGSSTTYTFATAGVADATYTDAGLVITTTYPLLTAPRWAIQTMASDAVNFLTGTLWANSSVAGSLSCSSRALY